MILPENVILASTSSRRRLLLERLIGDPFRVVAPGIDELETGFLPDILLKNAEQKAVAVADREQESLVIGADTAILIDDTLLGKPDTWEEARAMLRKLSGRTHRVFTAVSIIMRARDIQILFADYADVTFKTLSEETISAYFRKVDPFDKAGAYGIQQETDMLLDHLEGDMDTVIGFPVKKIKEVLENLNVRMLSDTVDE